MLLYLVASVFCSILAVSLLRSESGEMSSSDENKTRFKDVEGGSVQLNSGYYMPLMGLGTYKITGKDCLPAIEAALQIGYRCFDTAKKYENEGELGEAFAILLPKLGLSRSDIFITSKVFPGEKDYEETVTNGVQDSLTKLKTDYIDLYLVHYPTYDVFSDEANVDKENKERRKRTYFQLEECRKKGQVHTIGVSNYDVHHLKEMQEYQGVPVPAVNQVEYHPLFTRADIRAECEKMGVVLTAFGSLARNDARLVNHPVVEEMGKKYNKSTHEILLAFPLCQHLPVCPKSVHKDRLTVNYQAMDIKLAAEDILELSKLNLEDHKGNCIRAYGWKVL